MRFINPLGSCNPSGQFELNYFIGKSSGISTRESESLDRYLHEIGKEKLITPDDEVRLAKEIQKGSQRALEDLTKANLRFVVSVAALEYQNQGLSLSDLINEGNLGLIKTAKDLMKLVDSSLFHTLFGGFVSQFCRPWQSRVVSSGC